MRSDPAESSPAGLFESILRPYLSRPGVTEHDPMMSASGQFRVHDKIFAMLVKDRLVVKLPEQSVVELVAAGQAENFRTAGRAMREWASIDAAAASEWPSRVAEAFAFVSNSKSSNVSRRRS